LLSNQKKSADARIVAVIFCEKLRHALPAMFLCWMADREGIIGFFRAISWKSNNSIFSSSLRTLKNPNAEF
jgi:hypothetical protein